MKTRYQFGRFVVIPAIIALTVSASLWAGMSDLSPGLLAYLADKWGVKGQQRVLDMRQMLLQQAALPTQLTANNLKRERNWLDANNSFWNRTPYFSDKEHWGVDDYWATPIETLASDGADCEDYSIGKYFTLKDLGVPVQKLRITYVRALKWNESHMVLAYYPEPNAEPYILDNLSGEILLASQRTDLEPIYSFNDEDLWVENGGSSKSGKSSQIRLWRDLLEKMDKEHKR